jgi:hypothetical protein
MQEQLTTYVAEELKVYHIEWDEDDMEEYGDELPSYDVINIEFVKDEGSRAEAIDDLYIDTYGFAPMSYDTELIDHQEHTV